MSATRISISITALALFTVLGSTRVGAQCLEWQSGFHVAGMDHDVDSLLVHDDGSGPSLFAGGWFTRSGAATVNRIARWNGSTWAPLGSGITGNVTPNQVPEVFALVAFDDGQGAQLCAAGQFTTAGGVPARNVARWNGTSWSACATSMTTPHPSGATAVNTMATFDDGTGNALYIGGGFTTVNGVTVNNIAKWDGTNWSSLAGGCDGSVIDLAVFDDGTGPALYACGGFQNAGGVPVMFIAKWNGSTWSPLGEGTWGAAYTLCVYDDGPGGNGPALIAGGNFTKAGGIPANKIAKWDGANWSTMGNGVGGGQVNSMAVHDDGSGPRLYVGGLFNATGSGPGQFIASWDGSSWSALGAGMDQMVSAIATFDSGSGPALVAAGRFQLAGGNEALRIAEWRDNAWSRVGDGNGVSGIPFAGSAVVALTPFDDGSGPSLIVAGDYGNVGGTHAGSIAKWDGTAWTPFGSGMNNYIAALALYDDGSGTRLCAGGSFTTAGGAAVHRLVQWDGSSWSDVGGGVGSFNTAVLAMAVGDLGTGPSLFAGGTFTTAGSTAVNKVAQWNGSTWSNMGGGVFGSGSKGGAFINAIAVWDDGDGPAVYVGGHIVSAGGGVFAANIAKWNGTTWSALGSGADDFVEDLYVFDDGSGEALYASGAFSNMGGVPGTNAIARWKHGAWSAVGGGMNAEVMTMFGFDDGTGKALFAGGYFTTAGGVPASRVAKWNGTSWSALGAGIGPTSVAVRAFAAFDDGQGGGPDLYVGGSFESAGGVSAHKIAEWRGCGGVATAVCSGDGASAACPCANTGMPGHGCQNSASTGGSLAYATGTTTPDTVVLHAYGELPNALSIFLQGTTTLTPPVIFGDGLRCAGGSLKRLYQKNASGGAVSAPAPGDPSITVRSAALGDPIPSGAQRTYQVYYRDPNLGFCADPPGNSWNVSNGLRVQW